MLDIFLIDLFPNFFSKFLFIIHIILIALYNLFIWNSFRIEKNFLNKNSKNSIASKFLYLIISIGLFLIGIFVYNYQLLLTINNEKINNLYFDCK